MCSRLPSTGKPHDSSGGQCGSHRLPRRRKQDPSAQTLTQESAKHKRLKPSRVLRCSGLSLSHLGLLSYQGAMSKLQRLPCLFCRNSQQTEQRSQSQPQGLSPTRLHQGPGQLQQPRRHRLPPQQSGMPTLNSQSSFLSPVTARA